MAEGQAVKASIRVFGAVQGVGFRPFAARLAREHGLTGTVQNAAGQVEMEVFGPCQAIARFVRDLTAKRPPASLIRHMETAFSPLVPGMPVPGDFTIAQSRESPHSLAMPVPDLATCPDCLSELDTPGDPRFGNPFISCTHCGPRFSIMERLPYDRPNTAMGAFPLCPLCGREYESPQSRRYHAQTVCCNGCGPRLRYLSRRGEEAGREALPLAARALREGGIVAVKGIGGYHLACSPYMPETVTRLRELKGREYKPFAVMFETLGSLKEHCEASETETELLTSAARPIVLLRRKPSPIAEAVYTTSPDLGAFLPYTPLQHLLLRQTGPLVMTSANPSGLPIVKDDAAMAGLFAESPDMDGVLLHDRAILRRLDDSVAAVTAGKPAFFRRARGYVPLPLFLPGDGEPLLACGGQEKSTICLYRDGCAYLSGEMGGLDTREAEAVYGETVRDMEALLRISPAGVAYDPHPGYASARYARGLGLPLLPVWHHHAHICSVMAEHNLTEPVIGVAFDGTGYGTDGTLWGGEFLIATPEDFTRAGHLKPVPMLGGDESVRQGWKSAACLLHSAGLSLKGEPRAALAEAALEKGVNTCLSSSMGRVFDAVSAMLGICRESRYAGQCAVELEYAAGRYLLRGGSARVPAFPYELAEGGERHIIDLSPLIRALHAAHLAGEEPDALAWRFHVTVSRVVAEVCGRIAGQTGLRAVALSGGVFHNRLLLGQTVPLLEAAGLTVYRNHQVSPGDGGLALGQVYAALGMRAKEKEETLCASRPPES